MRPVARIAALLTVLAVAAAPLPIRDHPSVEALVQRLLADMTVPEKARQLVIHSADKFVNASGEFDAGAAASFLGTLGGGVFGAEC